jgi:hypothetical protein
MDDVTIDSSVEVARPRGLRPGTPAAAAAAAVGVSCRGWVSIVNCLEMARETICSMAISTNRLKLPRDETKFMLSIPLKVNYLENVTDGEIYPAYDIIGQILKMKKATGTCNLSVL